MSTNITVQNTLIGFSAKKQEIILKHFLRSKQLHLFTVGVQPWHKTGKALNPPKADLLDSYFKLKFFQNKKPEYIRLLLLFCCLIVF